MSTNNFRICMVTSQALPILHPFAATIRFINTRKILNERNNRMIQISKNTKLSGERDYVDGFVTYKVPSVNIRWIRQIFFMFLLLPTLIKVVKKEKPDILFVNSIFCTPSLYLLKKISERKLIVHYDVMGISYKETLIEPPSKLAGLLQSLLYTILDKIMLKTADIITTINETHKDILKRQTSKPIYVIRDGINLGNFVNANKKFAHIKKGDNGIFLMFVGSLAHKRLDALFSVIPQVIKKVPTLKLVIVGDGMDQKYYQQKAENLGLLNKKIFFTGHVDNDKLPSYLPLADICFSDVWSNIGFPMKVFEYMAMGKAIIVKDTPGVREILEEGVNAYLYENEKDLFEKIVFLAKNKELRENLGMKAKELVLKEHTWDYRGNQLMDIYRINLRRTNS